MIESERQGALYQGTGMKKIAGMLLHFFIDKTFPYRL